MKPAVKYGNFQDPVGLLVRMLRSGDSAARASLYREFLSIAAWPLNQAARFFESQALAHDVQKSPLPVILIVAPPRSGSTLVYQAIAASLPVSYLNNFSSLLPEAPITSLKWFNALSSLLGQPHQGRFENYYGNTEKLADPNDGFHLWNRWLGEDRYSAPDALPFPVRQDMNRFFNLWLTTFNKPFLNKNNRNLVCMDLLARSLDNVYFVVVNRDPVFIAQSLLVARKKVQGSEDIGWSVGSDQVAAPQGQDAALHSVAQQVAWISSKLKEQKQKVDPERIIEVDYEAFCQAPNTAIGQLYNKAFAGLPQPLEPPRPIAPFQVRKQKQLAPERFHKLENLIAHYLSDLEVETP